MRALLCIPAVLFFLAYAAAQPAGNPFSEIISVAPNRPEPVSFPKPVPASPLPQKVTDNIVGLPALSPVPVAEESEECSDSESSSSSEEHHLHGSRLHGKFHGKQLGHSGEVSHGGLHGSQGPRSEGRFGGKLEHAILQRILEGRAVELSLKHGSKLKLKQKGHAEKAHGFHEKPQRPIRGHAHHAGLPGFAGTEHKHTPHQQVFFPHSPQHELAQFPQLHPLDIAALQILAGPAELPVQPSLVGNSPSASAGAHEDLWQNLSSDQLANMQFPHQSGGSLPNFILPAYEKLTPMDLPSGFHLPEPLPQSADLSPVQQFLMEPDQLLALISASTSSPEASKRPIIAGAPTPQPGNAGASTPSPPLDTSTRPPAVAGGNVADVSTQVPQAAESTGGETSPSPKPQDSTRSPAGESTKSVPAASDVSTRGSQPAGNNGATTDSPKPQVSTQGPDGAESTKGVPAASDMSKQKKPAKENTSGEKFASQKPQVSTGPPSGEPSVGVPAASSTSVAGIASSSPRPFSSTRRAMRKSV